MGSGMFDGFDTFLNIMMVFALIGILALIVGIPFACYWIYHHVALVIK